MQNGGVSLVPKMEDHKPMPVSESFTQLLDNTNKNTTVSTSSAPLWSSSSSGYGVMDSNNKESKGFTRMIFQQHQQADSSYPCGPFTRLLDPSSNIIPDNLELSLDDFGTSTATTTTTTTAMQQQVPMPLQSLKPPTSSVPTFHGNKNINFGSKSQDGSSNNSTNPLRQKVGSPSSSSTSSNTTLHKSTVEEGGECTTEQKRSAEQAALNPVSANSNTSSKKTKVGSSGGTIKVRKEKLGERITALQHLVSPYGKTDTASVLLEAMGYIKFLQEQVQVLSSPYLKGIPASSQTATRSDQAKYDLRSRGLCLVPVSCTMHVANDNGADFWTSGVGSGSKY